MENPPSPLFKQNCNVVNNKPFVVLENHGGVHSPFWWSLLCMSWVSFACSGTIIEVRKCHKNKKDIFFVFQAKHEHCTFGLGWIHLDNSEEWMTHSSLWMNYCLLYSRNLCLKTYWLSINSQVVYVCYVISAGGLLKWSWFCQDMRHNMLLPFAESQRWPELLKSTFRGTMVLEDILDSNPFIHRLLKCISGTQLSAQI